MFAGVRTVVLALVSVAGGVSAQEATGRIDGRVLSPGAHPAAGVRITAESPSLQGLRTTETDARGYFRISALPVGTYEVRLGSIGYRPVLITDVIVRLGRTTSLGETPLESQALQLGELVVTAARPLIDGSSTAAVTNLRAEQFRDLPTGRNFRSLVSLAPQANKAYIDEANVAGGTGPENAYYLDGVNITDPQDAGTSTDLPFNFIKELQVKTGGYEAEYGRATGGIINVITHSGGNRFTGQVFGYFTNDGLTAEPRFGVAGSTEPDFSQYDVGGSVGGPIVRDRLWFFAAYAPSRFRQHLDVPGAELPDNHNTQHLLATKLTWQAGSRTDVTVTAHGDPTTNRDANIGALDDPLLDSLANPEAIVSEGRAGGLVLSTLVRHRLGENALVEVGVARFTRRDNGQGISPLRLTEPRFTDFTTGVVSGGFGESVKNRNVRTAAHGSIAVVLTRHALKFGVEYEDNGLNGDVDFSAQPGSPGGFLFHVEDTIYIWGRARFRASVHNRIPTFYAQDGWRLSERMLLNLGLRWDGQYLVGPSGEVAQSFTDQWQPRIGLIYRPGRAGSQKVFGSYARFYEQIPLELPAWYYDPQSFVILRYNHDPRFDPSGADTTIDVLFGPVVVEPRHDLKGQSVDEFTLGYERAIGRETRIGVRGIYRRLRWAVEDVFNPVTGQFALGNPGRGDLDFVPRAKRTYSALVLTFEKPEGRRFDFSASYVLSRSRGNYSGLFDYLSGGAGPNISAQFDDPNQYRNSTGLLPNDRPHVFKVSGAYRFDFRLTVGTALAWMSGTPRNEFGPGLVFLKPRGSAGRTESVLDAGVRLTYGLGSAWGRAVRPTVYLDVFQLGNRRSPLIRDDQLSTFDQDGNTVPNVGHGRPLEFQPPSSARLGLSIDFGADD